MPRMQHVEHHETYWPNGQIPPQENIGMIIGTKCIGCGTVLTADIIAAITDKVGVCTTCKPRGEIPAGMVQ